MLKPKAIFLSTSVALITTFGVWTGAQWKTDVQVKEKAVVQEEESTEQQIQRLLAYRQTLVTRRGLLLKKIEGIGKNRDGKS